MFKNIFKIVFPINYLSPSIIPAIAGAIAGSVVTGMFSKSSAKDQMRYQKDMSGTAHQREVKDLKAAGLNPILSAKYGGASTPPGAGYQMPNIGESFASAHEIKRKKAETSNLVKKGNVIDATVEQLRSQTALNISNSALASAKYNTELELKRKFYAEIENIAKQNKILNRDVAASVLEEKIDKTDYGEFTRRVRRLFNDPSSALRLMK